MSAVIRWEEPPPAHRGRKRQTSKYQAAVDALRSRPKEWALILENQPHTRAQGLASRITSGGRPFDPKGAFEVRRVGSNPMSIYARYVGEPS